MDALALDLRDRIYLSTSGDNSAIGVEGANDDIFVFAPTSLGTSTDGILMSLQTILLPRRILIRIWPEIV